MSSSHGPRDLKSWRLLKHEARHQVLRLVREGAALDARRIARSTLQASKDLSDSERREYRDPLEDEVRDYLLSLFQSRPKRPSPRRS